MEERKEQAEWQKTNTVFTNNKAGMEGVDKEHIKKVIYTMSKDSPHFKNEQRKQQQTEERIAKLLAKARRLGPQELAGHTRRMDDKIAKLVAERDLTRTWVHVDMDAFFASVEELHDPRLKSVPMGVGGIGMLSTTNYVARKYGVRSAMPGFIALKLCPELVFVKPNFQRYSEASKAVKDILRRYDADLDSASLDEAHLDITDYCKTHNLSGEEVAAEMRRKVQEETGLTCSCGIAPNRMLAKICSDIMKPNGQHAVERNPEAIEAFMAPLPIRKIPGIGKVAEQLMNALGVQICSDILKMRGTISALFSEITTDFSLAAALGLGGTSHHPPSREGEVARKGIGVERTFAVLSTQKDLESKCCELAAKLAEDMLEENLKAKTLTLKLKPPTFELKTRAVTLPTYISSEEEIRKAALGLLRAELPIAVRLMGLRMSSFLQSAPEPGQQSVVSFFKPKQDAGQAQSSLEDPHCNPQMVKPEVSSVDQNACRLGKPKPKGRESTLWECQHCTFAENSLHFLRCMICDSRKGTTPHYSGSAGDGAVQDPSRSEVHKGEIQTARSDSCDSGAIGPQPEPSLEERPLPSLDQNKKLPSTAPSLQESGKARAKKLDCTERQNMRKRKRLNTITSFFQAPSSKT